MNETSMKRRMLLKGGLAAGTLGVAVGAGLLSPKAVMAAWPKNAFESKSVDDALNAMNGNADTTESGDISIKVPEIAENGAVVPVTVSTKLPAEAIAIMAASNGTPLAAKFYMNDSLEGFVSTRIKMGKTGDIIALVKSGGKIYSAKKPVKVTIGGCGG